MRRAQNSDPESKQVDDRSYVVRPARAEDVRAVAGLEALVFGYDAYSEETLYNLMREVCSGCCPSPGPLTGTTSRTVPARLSSKCCAMYVADSSGSIIGYSIAQIRVWNEFLNSYGIDPTDVLYLNIKDCSKIGYLKSIAVHPDRRRQGIGKQFHTIRDAFLRDHGVKHIFLLQMPRPGLVDFHHSLGFQAISASLSLEYAAGGRARLWHRQMP